MPDFYLTDANEQTRDIGEPLLFVLFDNAWHARADVIVFEHKSPGALHTLEQFAASKGRPVRRFEHAPDKLHVTAVTLPGGCEITVYGRPAQEVAK